MRLMSAFVFVVVSCAGTSWADLTTFSAIDGQYASPDASTGAGNVNLWTNTPSGNSGVNGSFLGSLNQNGDGNNNGGAGAGPAPWWVLYAGNGFSSQSDATLAPLVGRNIGRSEDFIALNFDNGSFQSGGGREVGMSFFDNTGAHQFTFRWQAGDATYEIVDAGGVFNTGVPATDNGIRLTLTLLDTSGGYRFNMFNTQSSNPFNTTFQPRQLEQNTPTIASVRVYNANSGLSPNFDLYFDDLTVFTAVPEVSAALAVPVAGVFAGVGVWARRRFLRGRKAAA